MSTEKLPPFTVRIDNREQLPFTFAGLATEWGTLASGDYSLVGYETRVAVERKSKADIWMCCASERPRFERCLERLAVLERACVVIECDLRELSIRPEYIQRVSPATVVGSCISWSCRYRLPFYWCDSRSYAERVTVRFLAAFLKHVVPLSAVSASETSVLGREASAAVLDHLPTFPNVLPTGDAPDYRPTTPATANLPGAS